MRLRFDRGTIVLAEPPRELDLERLPGVQWDPRVQIHRAPAFRHPDLRAALQRQGVRFLDEVPDPGHLPAGFSDVELRPYQEEAHASWVGAVRRGVVVLPTGSGKTRLALAAIARAGRPALCLVPTRVLLDQWRGELGAVYRGDVGCFGDGQRSFAPVTVATYESAWRHMQHLGSRFSLLVVDEAHHFGAGARDEALEIAAPPCGSGSRPRRPKTAPRPARLAALVGPTVFRLSIDDLAGEYLASYRLVTSRSTSTWRSAPHTRAGWPAFRAEHSRFTRLHPSASWDDFVREAAASAEGRRAVAAWRSSRRLLAFCRGKRERLRDLLREHAGARVLVFTGDNEAAYAVAREHLIMPLTCDIGRSERDAALAAFRAGELRALVSSQVLNEGLDVPDADVAIIVAGRLGRREHIQRIGRLLRPAPGKRAAIYELVVRGSIEVGQSARKRAGLAPRRAAAG